MLITTIFGNAQKRLFCVPKLHIFIVLNGGFSMLENIILGLMVVAALGAAVFTCIYEMGGFTRSSEKGQKTENKKKNKSE